MSAFGHPWEGLLHARLRNKTCHVRACKDTVGRGSWLEPKGPSRFDGMLLHSGLWSIVFLHLALTYPSLK